MRPIYLCKFVVLLCLFGCNQSVPELKNPPPLASVSPPIPSTDQVALDSLRKMNTELRKQNAELINQNAELSSRIQKIEESFAKDRKNQETEIAKLVVEKDEALRGALELLDIQSKQVESEYQRAASNFAKLGAIEKDQAIRAFNRMKTEGPGSVNKQERDLVASVGTRETTNLVREWDLIVAKKYGFDEKTGEFATTSPPSASTAPTQNAPVVMDELTSQLGLNRKKLKDLQTKGTAMNRQISKMQGTESPLGIKKLEELESKFSEMKEEAEALSEQIKSIESRIEKRVSGVPGH